MSQLFKSKIDALFLQSCHRIDDLSRIALPVQAARMQNMERTIARGWFRGRLFPQLIHLLFDLRIVAIGDGDKLVSVCRSGNDPQNPVPGRTCSAPRGWPDVRSAVQNVRQHDWPAMIYSSDPMGTRVQGSRKSSTRRQPRLGGQFPAPTISVVKGGPVASTTDGCNSSTICSPARTAFFLQPIRLSGNANISSLTCCRS